MVFLKFVFFFCLLFKEFAANTNDDYTQIIVLQICIQARFIRINPVGWYSSIALRVEFFGCTIGPAPSSGTSRYVSTFWYLKLQVRRMTGLTLDMSALQESTDWLTDYLTGLPPGWLTGWLTDWLTDFLTGWLTDWLSDWLTDWPTH